MSGVEVLTLAASVVQLAATGLRLSVNLHTFTRHINSGDKLVDTLSHEIAATSAVLQQLGQTLSDQKSAQLCSSQAATTAQKLLDDCSKVFEELDVTIMSPQATEPELGHVQSSTRVVNLKRKLNLTYLQSQGIELKANLERLKSGFLVTLNVLILAEQMRRYVVLSLCLSPGSERLWPCLHPFFMQWLTLAVTDMRLHSQEPVPVLKDQQNLLKVLVEENALRERRYCKIVGPTRDRDELDNDEDNDKSVLSPFHNRATCSINTAEFNRRNEPDRVVANAE